MTEAEGVTLMITWAIMTRNDSRKIKTFSIKAGGQKVHNIKCEFISHVLWAIIVILWALFFILQAECCESDKENLKMGGARKRIEPPSCMKLKKECKLWKILEKGCFTSYIERL